MAYATIEPFGPVRDDQRSGVIAAMIANVNRDTSEHPEPFTVEEFLPRYEGESVKAPLPDEDRLKNKLTAWAVAMSENQSQEPSESELKPKKKG